MIIPFQVGQLAIALNRMTKYKKLNTHTEVRPTEVEVDRDQTEPGSKIKKNDKVKLLSSGSFSKVHSRLRLDLMYCVQAVGVKLPSLRIPLSLTVFSLLEIPYCHWCPSPFSFS